MTHKAPDLYLSLSTLNIIISLAHAAPFTVAFLLLSEQSEESS